MISVEEYLNIKKNILLEKSVYDYLLASGQWSTLEVGLTRDVNPSENTLGISRERIYKREFLEECFSNKNPNWRDGSLKHLVSLAPGNSNKFI